jgi:hypothetical protein
LLGVPLSGLLITLCVVMLAGWLPHYLTWPWWADLDTLASVRRKTTLSPELQAELW